MSVQAVELTGEESGKRVTVPLGETLALTLAGNPTSGYLWELTTLEREILTMEAGPAFAPDSSLAGAGGKFTFRFTPQQPGTTTIELIYHRPWEKDVPPLQTFELTVTIPAAAAADINASYLSSTGNLLKASFSLELDQVTIILPEGRKLTLPAAPSASGVRYSNGNETFWEHQGVGRYFAGESLLFEGTVLRPYGK